jgi:hypothetical protein
VNEDIATADFAQEDPLGALVKETDIVEWRNATGMQQETEDNMMNAS